MKTDDSGLMYSSYTILTACNKKGFSGRKAILLLFSFISFLLSNTNAQLPVASATVKTIQGRDSDLFGTTKEFIKNIGQYGDTMKGFGQMGQILYGYEAMGMPVLLTPKGLIHLHRKVNKITHAEEERLEKMGIPEVEIEHKRNITDRVITMEWLHANPDVKIIAEEKALYYHTYGMLPDKAYGYKKITYKNIYPGIDLVYNFTTATRPGFEYNLVVQPGADLSIVKLKYGGDIRSIKTDNKGSLIIKSDIEGISTSIPVSYYGESLLNKNSGEIKTEYKIENNEISFAFPNGYDRKKAIIIDPFVSSTSNLTGLNAGKAIDVDFDYEGNVYVSGGGSISTSSPTASHSHAKYNSAGVLQWTFNGILTIPSWSAGYYMGGWVVDKASGALYMGQGFAFEGFRVVRISTTGLYDNYISTANANFQENWKMYWFCNNGSPQIICAGGGTTGNNNIAICAPPSTTLLATSNLTGSVAAYQDMSDLVIDPVTNSLYSIYASGIDKTIENKIFKNNQPYSAATIAWNSFSGYLALGEIRNRPYINLGYNDNSSNTLALNANYLFYWDGKNLKAIDKATGATVGTPLTIAANIILMQGGIVADACNNVYIGNTNGTIKVYKFTGTVFDDAAANDIIIPGYSTNVYDLALDESKKLLYASGDGFVGSFDVTAYCPTTIYTVNVVPNCVTGIATATVSPAPPAGSTVTYTLYIGTTPIATNTTGVFTGLDPNITYTIVATINLACSGTQATATFTLPGPTITFTQTNTTCGASTGTITATGSGTPGPYSYSLNGGPFQPTGNFTGLAAGIYTLVVQGAGGCPNDTLITILNSNGPALTFTQTNAACGNNTGTVTANATGGTSPYQYSINRGVTYQTGNFFTGLVAGQYTLMVKDANNCTNSVIVTIITTGPAPLLTAIPASANCNLTNGTITAFGSGGVAPLQYSINGNTFQVGNIFTGLAPGTYTVTVKDAVGCIKTVTVTVGNSPAPTVTATTTPAACGNINGSITASGSGGVIPYQYSINGVTFQNGNVFVGLAPGVYTITIKDNTGCTSIVTATIASTNEPTVTATTGPSLCNTNSGSITATGSGGVAPYQYSINGVTFQAANGFTGLTAGNYVVYVRDNTGCIGTITVVVGAVAGPTINATVTASSCTANTGTITASGTGGTAPLEYSIDGTNYFLTGGFTGLAPGIYTVYVRDANGCIKTTTVTVANASGLALSVATISASCGNNGIITATATGGTAPLQYSINGTVYQVSNLFNGIAPGTYTVYVRDANNCIITKQAIVLSATALALSVSVPIQATCASSNGVIVATGSGGSAPLTYSIDGTVYQSSGTFINVAPGTYTVYVKDAAGCIVTQVITVTTSGTGPGISTFTVAIDNAYVCNSGLGRITNPRVNGANCVTCTFSLDFGPFVPNATQLFLNVPLGTHTVTAKDANGCTKTILATVDIATLTTATATVTASSCGVNNGTITLTGAGANTPYHASITGIGGPFVTFDPIHTFTGLASGTYTVIMADDEDYNAPNDPGNCITTFQVIVPSTGGPSIATTQNNPACNANTGSITATGSGGTGPYTYNINGGVFIASGVFNNLTPGTYIVQVRDNTGCINAATVVLASTAVPTVTVAALAASCNVNNGSITATGTGGTAPLEYSINGTVFQASNIFTGLAAGTYTVYVKDANRCFSRTTVIIANTPRVQVTAFSIAATCGNNDGSIVATGSLGTAPYTFSINGTVYQSSGAFSNLSAGFYTVYIKDARDCITTIGVTVTNIGAPVFTTAVVSAKCGSANGSITVTATGGSGNYQYSRDGGLTFQAGNILTPLTAGTYVVAVKDINNGCITSQSVLVADITGPQTLTAVIVDAACGNANGSITATATGGTTPLQYSINGTNYFPTNVFTGILAGSYTLYVRDANLCVRTLPVTVLNLSAPLLSATSSPSSCGSNDGTITAIATGGTLPLTYSKNGITFQTSNIFLGLAAGPYTITVKDARGCTTTFDITVSTIGSTITPVFNPVGPICSGALLAPLPTTSINGITGTWTPALNNTATTTYTFTPTAGQCAVSTTLTIVVNPNTIPTFNAIAPICSGGILNPLPTTSTNGITGTWTPALNNTTTTTYTFTPTAGQCATTATLTITVNPNTVPTFATIAPICSGGTLNALPTTSTNGITGTWTPALNNTATTTYTFTPTAGQCAVSTTLTIVVNPNTIPIFATIAPICSGGILNPLPTTSTNGITGTWTPALNNTATTTYTFTPTAGQCATTTTLTITVNPNIIPTFNAIAPICSGGILNPLPTTSTNGITGTWTPALNNTTTTTYTFTPTAGQCATTTTLTITVNPNIIPTFTAVAPICSGGILNALPTISTNGITGIWTPALNNTATTTYTFTPTAGQCATTATLTITVNPILSATVNCGISTSSSVQFNWAGVTGATDYLVSYQIGANPVVTIGSIGNVLTYQVTGLTGGDNVTITVTPTGGIGNCFAAASASCIATPCTPPTATISYATPLCVSLSLPQSVTLTGTGIFTGGSYTAPAGLTINSTTGSITPNTSTPGTYIVTYTVAPSGGCPGVTATTSVTIDAVITPAFTAVAPICSGGTLNALPTTSTNGITGTWTPALNNTTTTTYTFTPAAGQCATTTTLIITVNPNIIPGFIAIGPLCQNSIAPLLPAISTNGISGTWSPSTINTTITGTTTYTFTPASGQCAIPTTLTIIVNALPSRPTITVTDPTCTVPTGTILITSPTSGLTFSLDGGPYSTYPPSGYTNILTGTHTLTAQNTNGCISASVNAIVNAGPVPPSAIAITVTDASCGTNNGTLTLGTVTGGTAPFTYSVDGGPFTTQLVYPGLPAGTHPVIVKDANACSFSASGIINNSSGATVTATSINAICGNASGSITATGAGGTTPYQYSTDGINFQSSNVFNGLVAATYIVTIKDANNCINSITITVASTSGATVTASSTDASCAASNGSITATGTGGTTPYQYSINGTVFQPSSIFTGLTAGSYTITIKDANNCVNTTSISINSTNGATVTATGTDASCGNSNGSITATGTGGTSPYQYSINGTSFQASNVFTALSAGTYTVTIKDANNCINTTSVIIASSGGATVTAVATDASCGAANGSITATGTGGVIPYQYSIDGITFQANNTFTGLAAGAFTVTIKDANNCINTTSVIIASSGGATVTAIATDASCGATNGTITATGAGGATPYQYSINGTGFQTSNLFNGLSAGSYIITIKDANNCTNTTTISINTISAPAITVAATNSSCGNNNGSINAIGSGGTVPYQYSIDGTSFQTSNIFTGLAAGNYTVTIKDANNCINTASVTIQSTGGASITAASSNSTCGNSNGTITATGTGGTIPYQYSINGASFQTSNLFTGITAGSYTVSIKDANNCINTVPVTVVNIPGASITVTTTASTCGTATGTITALGNGGTSPYLFSINGGAYQQSNVFTGLINASYTVTIKDANNCISTATGIVDNINPVTVNAGPDITICEGTAGQLNATSNGVSFAWSPATSLSNPAILKPLAAPRQTATYILTASDGACSKKDTVTVNVIPAPVPDAGRDTGLCFGKNGRLNGSGGLTYQWSPSNFLSNPNSADPMIQSPPVGLYRYILKVTSAAGCQSLGADTVQIRVLPLVKVFAGNDTVIVVNQPLQLNALDKSNSDFTSYVWSPATGLSNAQIKNPVAILSKEITYLVTARTADGCEAVDDIQIKVFQKADLFVPNAFTPNGDGLNDKLHVIPVGIKELTYFRIFNRWGQLVFTTKNPGTGWDGTVNGQLSPSGTFVWMAEGIDYLNNKLVRKGFVVLIH